MLVFIPTSYRIGKMTKMTKRRRRKRRKRKTVQERTWDNVFPRVRSLLSLFLSPCAFSRRNPLRMQRRLSHPQ